MHVLVLDTTHGGTEIGRTYAAAGHSTDIVDVYHGTTPDLFSAALTREYDMVVAPVHLDPDHPLIAQRHEPLITHHEAVRRLLGDEFPTPMIEITGARGKTTTAHALSRILPGKGVLHTSTGTYICPTGSILWKKSITPASILPAAQHAKEMNGWLIAEVSLGVTGAGDLAIITSAEDYTFANGKKRAVGAKTGSAGHAKHVLVAEGIACSHPNVTHIEDVARCDGETCTLELDGVTHVLKNPLFRLPPYRTPMMLAAAAAMILQMDPSPLNHFEALTGRMSASQEKNLTVIDNSNSGTNAETTICACRYARHCAGTPDLTLVIGQPEGDGKVCEGFSPDQIVYAINKVMPSNIIWVGRFPDDGTAAYTALHEMVNSVCRTLEEGKDAALHIAGTGSVVLSVKTWR